MHYPQSNVTKVHPTTLASDKYKTVFITARNSSCEKVMFSQASVSHSVQGEMGISCTMSFPSGGG